MQKLQEYEARLEARMAGDVKTAQNDANRKIEEVRANYIPRMAYTPEDVAKAMELLKISQWEGEWSGGIRGVKKTKVSLLEAIPLIENFQPYSPSPEQLRRYYSPGYTGDVWSPHVRVTFDGRENELTPAVKIAINMILDAHGTSKGADYSNSHSWEENTLAPMTTFINLPELAKSLGLDPETPGTDIKTKRRERE